MLEDNSINPPEDKEDNDNELYAPLEALAQDGETPGVGDKVTVEVEGTIEEINNGVACITPETINGQPAPKVPEEKSLRDTVMGQMQQADANG